MGCAARSSPAPPRRSSPRAARRRQGNRSSKTFGESKLTVQEGLSLTANKDSTEEVKGDAAFAIKGPTAWYAHEVELKSDKLTISVGGNVVLTVEKSGDIKWTGKSITVDGSETKFKGSKVKLVAAGSQKSLKGKKPKDPKKEKQEPVPSIKEVKWGKAKGLPDHNSGAPPGGATPAEAKSPSR